MSGEGAVQDQNEIRRKLTQYGFSEKEAETYLAVVNHGSAKVSTIAEDSDVSASYLYDICERLQSRDFVIIDDHLNPTQVRARPPEEVFGTLQDDLSTIESAVQDRYDSGIEQQGTFEVIKSRATVVKRIEALIESSQSEVVLQIPVSVLSEIRSPLREALERDVLLLLTLSGEREQIYDVDVEGIGSVVRAGIESSPTIVAVDQQRGLFASEPVLKWEHNDEQATLVEQDQLASVLVGSYLGNFWGMAIELAISRPPKLPKSYQMIRPSVYTMTRKLWNGDEIHARMEARPSHTTEEFDTISGEVVDVRQNLIEPRNADFGLEHGFAVEIDGEVFWFGGSEAFREDFETRKVTLFEG